MDDCEYDPAILPNVLPLYYKRLFPYDPFYRWLRYERDQHINTREFSFTLMGDVYLRYQHITSKEDLMKKLQKENPIKIDIGAVYTSVPSSSLSQQKNGEVNVKFRELVFDIDMTDYDEVRTCCSGTDVCVKCWKFMCVACKILDAALREDFGFEHILWVFSGRRGVHCWVCDEIAKKLNTFDRSGVVDYLNLLKGSAFASKRVELPRTQIHSSVQRALNIAEEYFEDVCLVDQDILRDNKMEMFIKSIGEGYKDLKKDLYEVMMKKNTSKARWDAFLKHVNYLKANRTLPVSLNNLPQEMMLQYLYPRLDIQVSKGLKHLLKSPFSIHPKTGKVSTPFNPKAVDNFNPLTVPTLSLLMQEINAFDAKTQEQEHEDEESSARKIKDYKKTSMYKGIVVFEEFVRKLESNWKKCMKTLEF